MICHRDHSVVVGSGKTRSGTRTSGCLDAGLDGSVWRLSSVGGSCIILIIFVS